VVEFKQRIRAADAILFSTAEYNYGIPGVLKNAIDVASRPYGVRAQIQLRQCFIFLDMDAVVQPEVAIATAQQRFDGEGHLTDETSKKLIGVRA
jgi:chromate reductase, NAD(P)H dehydrogenase (quinone)